MTAHELARELLAGPDLPVATHAKGHTYLSRADRGSHGPLKVGVFNAGVLRGSYVMVGDRSTVGA